MMRQCWEWMMSLGGAGMLLGVILVAALGVRRGLRMEGHRLGPVALHRPNAG
jgi:hypothetical protein